MEMKLPPISYSVTRSPQASAPRKTESPQSARISPTLERKSSAGLPQNVESMRISTPEQQDGAASPPAAEIPGLCYSWSLILTIKHL